MIVVVSPGRKHGPGVIARRELADVQAFVAQLAVERLAKPVLDGPSWPNEVELHAALAHPVVQRPRREFGAVIDRNRLGWQRPLPSNVTEDSTTRISIAEADGFKAVLAATRYLRPVRRISDLM